MSTASAPQDANVSLYLHAELLPNIRQITLYVSLPQTAALEGIRPQIQLSESCKSVTVSLSDPFDHVAETIKLPARVTDATRRTLNINTAASGPRQPTSPGYDYSVRMHIDPSDPVLAPRDELIDDHVPWTAADMSSSTRIRCRGCGTPFLKESGPDYAAENSDPSLALGWFWKDLPSGNWAEMMDFWHCHKPDPHEEDPRSEATAALKLEDQTAQTKGYGASSRVEAISGTVLIDVATFLLSEEDCVSLKKTWFVKTFQEQWDCHDYEESNEEETRVATPEGSFESTLECATCNSVIGMEDPSASGWRLLKANVSLNANVLGSEKNREQWQSHPTQTIVAAQLLELIERESARRFVVHCGQKSGLLLWVFNPDLRYSNSSSGHSVNAQQAMKVFFQVTREVDKLLAPEIGNPSPLSVEELELPSMVYEALSEALQGSNQMLPPAARQFNEWQVGLLSRFSRFQAT